MDQLWQVGARSIGGHDDAESLRLDTAVPGPVWIAAWTALAGGCLWLGAGLLWPF